MNVPLWVWLATVAVVIGMLVFDFVGHARDPHEPTLRESAIWSAGYIAIALLFGVGVGVFSGWQYGGEYMAGWLTEKALSVDNLFVFLLIMTSFAVPKVHQQKVLLIGIAIAIVMRGAFIAVGAVIIEQFVAVFYLFAIILFWLAWSQIREALSSDDHEQADAGDSGSSVWSAGCCPPPPSTTARSSSPASTASGSSPRWRWSSSRSG